jgi:pimeloyl-ACP methyl ester carboxylesterase
VGVLYNVTLSKMETKLVSASDGVGLAVHRLGAGPPLYAVHGGPASDHRCFGDYLARISQYRELFLLDQRGCGQSEDSPQGSYTIERLSEDIENTRSALGHDTIDLLAYSFGGVIGVDYGRRWPDRIRALVFVGAAVSGWYGPLIEPRGWPLWFRAMTFRSGEGRDFADFHLAHEVGNRAKREEVRNLLLIETRHDAARVQPLTSAGMRRNRLEPLVEQVATFGIYGKQDRRFLGDAKYLERIGATVVFIEGAGHFPFVEQPDVFHRTLEQFLGVPGAVD